MGWSIQTFAVWVRVPNASKCQKPFKGNGQPELCRNRMGGDVDFGGEAPSATNTLDLPIFPGREPFHQCAATIRLITPSTYIDSFAGTGKQVVSQTTNQFKYVPKLQTTLISHEQFFIMGQNIPNVGHLAFKYNYVQFTPRKSLYFPWRFMSVSLCLGSLWEVGSNLQQTSNPSETGEWPSPYGWGVPQ